MNLRSKFLNVMKGCAYVQKLGENTFHRYKYATAADVFDKVNTALVEQGIISVAKPTILSIEQVTTSKGNAETRVMIEMTVTLTDISTGETMQLTAFGSGQDTGDKAVMKAQTAALKYCYMMSLNISTGDDPEADVSGDSSMGSAGQAVAIGENPNTCTDMQTGIEEAAPAQQGNDQKVTAEQLKIIFVLAKRVGIADEVMKERIYQNFKVATSRDLTKEQASVLITELKSEVPIEQVAG